MKPRLKLLSGHFTIVLALLIINSCDSGCSNNGCNANWNQYSQAAVTECNNNIDDDSDGLVDTEDPGCSYGSGISEVTRCQDGIDNDQDGLTDFPEDPYCESINSNTEDASCLVVEVCGNDVDDDQDGDIDEDECAPVNDYLANWKNIGSVVDYVVFGTYSLYVETQADRDLDRQSWGSWCAGQHGTSSDPERDYYCLGSGSDYLEWNMTVPEAGYYVLMLSDVHGTVTNHQFSVDRGAGFEALPAVVSGQRISLLMHNVGGYPGSIFYLIQLNAGVQRFRIDNGTSFFDVTSAVLARLRYEDHFYDSPAYPHLHFTEDQIDDIKDAPNPAQQELMNSLATAADGQMDIDYLPDLGRGRGGVLESLAYSGIFNDNAEHMDKAIELYMQLIEWVSRNDGDYRDRDILEYGYDMQRFGACFDIMHNAMTDGQRIRAKELLRVEMMRHALSNISGQWWRMPMAGGWTSSHAQGGQLGLSLYYDDMMARFYVDVSVLMYQTSLLDNVSIDGVHLQSLSSYYGWDFWNLVYFQNALSNNPGVTAVNFFEYDDRALRKYYNWLIYSLSPTRRCMGPFGTSNCVNCFYASMGSTLLLAADYYNDGALKWLYENTVGDNAVAAVVGDLLPEAMAWLGNDTVTATDPAESLPLGYVTRENEHAYMRTGWGENDIAFMTRCGLSGNHDQAEHGSIILYADGHNYIQTYNGYSPTDPTHTTSAKNYILIDGRGQTRAESMTARMGTVPLFLHSSSVDYLLCDNSYAYNYDPGDPGSFPVEYSDRRIIFVRPGGSSGGYFVVLDQIKADDDLTHQYQFLLHTGCRMQWWGIADGSCEAPLVMSADPGQGATISDADPESNLNLKVRFIDPPAAGMTFSIESMPVESYPDFLRASRSSTSLTGEFMTILFPEDPDNSRTLPPMTILSPGANQAGVLFGNDTIIWSKDGSAIAASNISSDALAVVVRNTADPAFAAMLEGSALSINGTTYLDVSDTTSAVLLFLANGMELTIGNEMTTDTIDVTLSGLQASATYTCTLNGLPEGTLTSNAQGAITFTGLGPGKSVLNLVQ